jgi:hypothetical protein
MANVVIDSTVISVTGEVGEGKSGEAILPGYPMFMSRIDYRTYKSDPAAENLCAVDAVAVSEATDEDERVSGAINPAEIDYGAGALSIGTLYSAASGGGLAPLEDITSGYPSLVGFARTTSALQYIGWTINQQVTWGQETPTGDVAVTKCEITADTLKFASGEIRTVRAGAAFSLGEILNPMIQDGLDVWSKASASDQIDYATRNSLAIALGSSKGAGNRVPVLFPARHMPGKIQIDLGATLVQGCVYVLSGTSGQIMPYHDLQAGQYPTPLGWGDSDGHLRWCAFGAGVAKTTTVTSSSSSSSSPSQ